MFVACIGDLDSDMYMAKPWDQPDFIYTYFFHISYLQELKSILKISLKLKIDPDFMT